MSGIRYSDDEKAKVLNFIENYDQEYGRGGKLKAFKKFKIAPFTIRGWIKEQGKKPVEKDEPVKAVNKFISVKAPVQVSSDLKKQIALHIDRIEMYSGQIAELQARIEREKESIKIEIE